MKNQALFSSKDKSKKLKCRLLQFLFGALRVKSVLHRNANTANFTFCLSKVILQGKIYFKSVHCCISRQCIAVFQGSTLLYSPKISATFLPEHSAVYHTVNILTWVDLFQMQINFVSVKVNVGFSFLINRIRGY